ncbi:MAG: hypothetical protein V3T30_02060 [Thermodesulfobacteriota bacterium]
MKEGLRYRTFVVSLLVMLFSLTVFDKAFAFSAAYLAEEAKEKEKRSAASKVMEKWAEDVIKKIDTIEDGETEKDNAISKGEMKKILKGTKLLTNLFKARKVEEPKVKFDAIIDNQVDSLFSFIDDNRSNVFEKEELINRLDLLAAMQLDEFYSIPFSKLIPKKGKMPIVPKETAFIDTLEKSISIRKSFFDEKKMGMPATLTWTHYGDRDETVAAGKDRTFYQFIGAITLDPNWWNELLYFSWPTKVSPGEYKFSWNPVLVYEVNYSSDSKDNLNRFTQAVGFDGTLHKSGTISGFGFNLKGTYNFTTDSGYDAEAHGGTLQFTPSYCPMYLGFFGCGDQDKVSGLWLPYARWRLYLGFKYANVTDHANIPLYMKFGEYSNLYASFAGELKYRKRITITPKATVYRELKNDKDTHLLFTVSGKYMLDKNNRLFLDVTFERGEKPPSFKDIEKTMLSLGIKL